VDQIPLVSEKALRTGKQLIQLLEKSGMQIESALWLNDPERSGWRLVLATKGASENLRGEYLKVSTILLRDQALSTVISSSDVEIVAPNNKIIRLLSEGIGKSVRTRTRWERSTVKGTVIEDAFIYRLAA
jgi:hypothetical protein